MIACGSPLLNSLYLLKNGPSAIPLHSIARSSIGIFHEITALLLLAYVLSRRKLRFKDIGLQWSWRDTGIGLLVAVVSYASYIFGSLAIHLAHYAIYGSIVTSPRASDFFGHPSVLAVPFYILNPFFEELIVRAYLMTEILELTGSSVLAVLLSIAVQFSYHLYYGFVGASSMAFIFLVLALYYVRSRRALPVIIAHEIFDISAMIRLWIG